MALSRTQPLHFSPSGVSDTLDATAASPGAMAKLSNLIPDPSTKNLFVCRPAAEDFTDFQGLNPISNPDFVSVYEVIGTRVYGMVASSLHVGYDQPFCYDFASGTLRAISGVTALNVPHSPQTFGDWTPPTMALVGTKVVITHPGYNDGTHLFGWIETNDPNNLSYDAGNTAVFPLPAAPTAVGQFNDRAYFLINTTTGNPSLVVSDTLDATTRTNAGYVLTFGDNVKLTALAGLPLNNQLGGVIQSMIVFKGDTNMFQVTGDPAIVGTWDRNALNIATGTLAPRSIAATTKGLMFMSPDGLRLIDFNAQVSDPIGFAGVGVTVPFLNPLQPTRMAAAATASIYRISVKQSALGSPYVEYWFDMVRGIWTGPHTFPYSNIKRYGNTFVGAPVNARGSLWQSDVVPVVGSSYTENGDALTWDYKTAMLPDPKQMSEFAMVESTLNLANVPSIDAVPQITVTAGDQDGNIFDTVTVAATGATVLWGATTWGGSFWLGLIKALFPYRLNWTRPLVFRRLYIEAVGPSSSGVQVGDLFMRYEQLGYLQPFP